MRLVAAAVGYPEIFGHVGVITTFTDIDDAIAQANDTDYGLAACVWTTNHHRTPHGCSHRGRHRPDQHPGRDEHRQPPLRRLKAVRPGLRRRPRRTRRFRHVQPAVRSDPSRWKARVLIALAQLARPA
ncbi:aldehyde dehydrogenase family protein [Streptomyces sp. SID9727]|nr:aldehyde dehydrogenase family protein [Streptomyces sp. SID9727]